jgi:mycobactin peptide synthetase MbtF
MMLTNPTIRMLAAAIDTAARPDGAADSADYGDVPPLPMVSWLCEYGNYRRFNHNFLLRLPADIDRTSIESVLQLLLDRHDTLRSILSDTAEGPRLITREPGVVTATDLLSRVDLTGASDDELNSAIAESARRAIDEIDPARARWCGRCGSPAPRAVTSSC